MFGFYTKQVRELEKRIESIKETLDLEEQRKKDALALEEYENRNAKISFAWEKHDVFAVERQFNRSGGPVTIIGYFFNDGDKKIIKEWFIYCSIEAHNKLVDEFNAHRNKK